MGIFSMLNKKLKIILTTLGFISPFTFALADPCNDFGILIKNTTDYPIIADINYQKTSSVWERKVLPFKNNMTRYYDLSYVIRAVNTGSSSVEINVNFFANGDIVLTQPIKIRLSQSSGGIGKDPKVESIGEPTFNDIEVRLQNAEPGLCGQSIAKAFVLVGKVITMKKR